MYFILKFKLYKADISFNITPGVSQASRVMTEAEDKIDKRSQLHWKGARLL